MMTFLSRILGLFRDIIIAIYFGSKTEADVFFVAFKIPNFLRRLFAEGAFSQAFVPVLSEYKTKYSKKVVLQLVNEVSGSLILILSVLSGLAIIGSPWVAFIFAPGFYDIPEKLNLVSVLLKLTFPYLFFISLTAFAGSILNSYGRFAIPAFTPVLLNVSLIGATIILTPMMEQPVMALGWGVLIAGTTQLLLQIPFLSKISMVPKPTINRNSEGVKKIIKLMLPALFGVSVSQINLLLDTILASFLETGSVSWLYYADRLSELPLGVFAIAVSTVILPSLSKSHTLKEHTNFTTTLTWAVKIVLIIAIPAAVALFILAEPVITTIFYYGEMTVKDVQMSAAALRAYSAGLVAFMLIKVFAPGFFARQNTRKPVEIAIKAMLFNMILNLVLIYHFKHVGLALATSISAFLNAGLLMYELKKLNLFKVNKEFYKYVISVFVASMVLAALLTYLKRSLDIWLHWNVITRSIKLLEIMVLGLASYVFSLFVCGIRLKSLKL